MTTNPKPEPTDAEVKAQAEAVAAKHGIDGLFKTAIAMIAKAEELHEVESNAESPAPQDASRD